MLIFNQPRNVLVNFDAIKAVYADKQGKVVASYGGQNDILLGDYKFRLRACQVIEKMAENEGACNVFYMPEV